jgi:putative membrane protein
MTQNHRPGPVLFDLDHEPAASPETAAPVPDIIGDARPAAMQHLAVMVGRGTTGRLGRWFWGTAGALVSFVVTLAAYNYAAALLASHPLLGWIATALFAAFGIVLAVMALGEIAAFARLRRLDGIQQAAGAALTDHDLAAARAVVARLDRLYAGRPEASWGRARLAEQQSDIFDADGLLGLAESTLLAPLDQAAQRQIEGAARRVATITAIVPLALADVAVALTANLAMIRAIAQIYGGRAGVLGSWRLIRSVMTHLVATGAVAVGDDMIHSVAGGGLLSKLSRRFGEGVINGALTARVGVAAMEVCRPLPFIAAQRPAVSALVRRALAGLFGASEG